MEQLNGLLDVDGARIHRETRGQEGTPLVLVHGGYGTTAVFDEFVSGLGRRRVVRLELEGFGRSAFTDAEPSFDRWGEQVAAVAREARGTGGADVLGYSLGGLVALRAALRHPGVVRRLVLLSSTFAQDGWYPDTITGMRSQTAESAALFDGSPMRLAYDALAPRPDFPRLVQTHGRLLGTPYDWSAEVPGLVPDTLLVAADADSIPLSHTAAFHALLGGGAGDAGWDGASRSRHQVAVLAGRTHYDVLADPVLAQVVSRFTT